MKWFFASILFLLFSSGIFAQTDLQRLFDTETAFEKSLAEHEAKFAFQQFLSDDSVIFRPDAVNGREFWKTKDDSSPERMIRNLSFIDISSNGSLGYSTGNFALYPKGISGEPTEFGQYATIWEKRQGGKYLATVDIVITHEKTTLTGKLQILPTDLNRDPNKRGWSAADPSMNFLRLGMSPKALGGAYSKFAADDIRLLREDDPPILGKKQVVSATKDFISIDFPKKIAMLESADMAYVWNPCEFADSNEGKEKGNCLNVWKLREKKWYIVLSVLARVRNLTKPTIKLKQKSKP